MILTFQIVFFAIVVLLQNLIFGRHIRHCFLGFYIGRIVAFFLVVFALVFARRQDWTFGPGDWDGGGGKRESARSIGPSPAEPPGRT